MASIIVTEKSYPNQQHGTYFYKVAAAIYPVYLVATARASKWGWGATCAAAVYMLIIAAMVWILPLFPAHPKLAPIYNPVDHMVPPNFPLLLIVPGIAIDLMMKWARGERTFWRDTRLSIGLGAAFVGTLFLAQYFFAAFLITPAADNWFFAGNHWWPYFIRLGEHRFRFWNSDSDPLVVGGMMVALTLAIVKSRIALAVGNWMSKVQR
jgi:hypothetical protein